MQLSRKPGWRTRLNAALPKPDATFSWAGGDCLLGLVAPAVEAMTGEDVVAPWRGKYDTPQSARALLSANGFADLGAYLGSVFPEIPVAQAHIGDIAFFPTDGDGVGAALGIVIGERVMTLSENGPGTLKLTRATRAFRVG